MDNVLCKIMVRFQFQHLYQSLFVLWEDFAAFIILVAFLSRARLVVGREFALVY